jgi:hypothetical protein
LYDFVRFDFSTWSTRPGKYEERLCEEAGLLQRFHEYKDSQPNYGTDVLVKRFVESLTRDDFASFNAKYFGGKRLYHGLGGALPVVCLDSPIYVMELDDSNEITFSNMPWLVLPVRIRQWRTSFHRTLVPLTAEVPVIITNPEGLPEVLNQSHDMFEEMRQFILDQPPDIKESALLQMALKGLIPDDLEPSFRSDLEIDWL